VLKMIRELCARGDLTDIVVEKPGFRLRLARSMA
jgi:hypothetical protein